MRRITLAAAAATIALSLAACTPETESNDDSVEDNSASSFSESSAAPEGQASQDVADEAAPAGAGIILEGTASGAANVSYGAGGSTSTSDIDGTWSETITDAENADIYVVTVMDSTGADDAEVSCKITTDGEVQAEESATGGFAIATCTQPIF